MAKVLTKSSKHITLSKEDYWKLMEAYQKISEILYTPKKKKVSPPFYTLYGVWKGVKVEEKDFQNAKKSLFSSSL